MRPEKSKCLIQWQLGWISSSYLKTAELVRFITFGFFLASFEHPNLEILICIVESEARMGSLCFWLQNGLVFLTFLQILKHRFFSLKIVYKRACLVCDTDIIVCCFTFTYFPHRIISYCSVSSDLPFQFFVLTWSMHGII